MPALAVQRHVVQVLGARHLHGKLHRVAGPGLELGWARSRLHVGVTRAAVLLVPVLDHREAALDHGDLLRVLELILPLAALVASPARRVPFPPAWLSYLAPGRSSPAAACCSRPSSANRKAAAVSDPAHARCS